MHKKNSKQHKKALSIIELLVVVVLITSISTIIIGRGAEFVRSFRLRQEKQTFDYIIKRAQMWANIQEIPLEMNFLVLKDSSVVLKIDAIKFRKTFSFMALDSPARFVTLYPHEACFLNQLKIRWIEND